MLITTGLSDFYSLQVVIDVRYRLTNISKSFVVSVVQKKLWATCAPKRVKVRSVFLLRINASHEKQDPKKTRNLR